MASVYDKSKDPGGVLQLGPTQQHLVWGQRHSPVVKKNEDSVSGMAHKVHTKIKGENAAQG